MKRGLKFLLFLILFLPSIVLGKVRTRSDVINEAMEYKNLFWTPRVDNLLDVKHCDVNADTTTYPNRMVPGGNGIDDRREFYNTRTKSCDEDSSHWPFEVGNTYTGEAYAFGGRSRYGEWGFDSPVEFSSKINSIERWIAGARQEDVALLPNITVMPDDYKGFAGIDCSGLVSRVWGLKSHYSTWKLTKVSVEVDVEKLKRGDILNKTGKHTIIFKEWKSFDPVNRKAVAKVIHATGWSITNPMHVRRVIEDEVEMAEMPDGNIYIYWPTKGEIEYPYDNWHLYGFYSAFPQFEWDNSMNVVRLMIMSGTPISTSSIIMTAKGDNGIEIPITDFILRSGIIENTNIYYSHITYDLRRNPNIRYEGRYKVVVRNV